MYLQHWRLTSRPFNPHGTIHGYFASATHSEALARLQYAAEARDRLAIVAGLAGQGKSLVLEVLGQRLGRQGWPVARINLTGLEPQELLSRVATQWGSCPRAQESLAQLWQRVELRWEEFSYLDVTPVILWDDIQQASAEATSAIVRLLRHQPRRAASLVTVASCCRRSLERLDWRLREFALFRIELEPWDAAEIDRFVQTSLEQCGARHRYFDPGAIQRIFELTHGVPRRVAHLAELSLMAGAAENICLIEADTVDAAHEQLGAGSASTPHAPVTSVWPTHAPVAVNA
jgi:type II secretory pathway predicted ATPase ExeA